MAKDYAKALSEDNIDRPTTELHEANNALISQIIMETLMDNKMSTEERMKAANSIAQLQGAQVRNEKLKIDARKASGEIRTAVKLIKTAIFESIATDYPDLAEKIMEITDNAVHEMV